MSLSANSSSPTSIAVRWDQPRGASRVSFYHVQFTPVCGVTSNSIGYLNTTNTTITIEGIAAALAYIITVQAVNALGMGEEANITASGILTIRESVLIMR